MDARPGNDSGESMAVSSSRLSGLLKAGCLLAIAVAIHPKAMATGQEHIEISLTRSACYGSCPAYQVTIHGDGLVHFTTGTSPVDAVDAVHRRFARARGVLLPGTHEDRIQPEAVQALARQFEAADFWQLKDEYRARVSDSPTKVVTLAVADRKKTVIDYVGTEAGMPKAVKELEEAIDRLAGTDRWVNGTADLIPWLEKTHFDFHSNQAAVLAVDAEATHADEATVIALIERGAPLDQTALPSMPLPGNAVVAGISLIEDSIRRGHAEVFKRMVKGGWLDRLGKAKAAASFADLAAGCSPAMVDAAADAGVDIDFAVSHPSQDKDEPQERTALAMLEDWGCTQNEAARLPTAERLLARGANPNHRDSLGRTPLYGVHRLDVLNLLLAHGADATAKSKDGNSMLFGSWDEAVILRLLQAGASPRGRYGDDGRTLAQMAKAQNMASVTKWLAAHPGAYRR